MLLSQAILQAAVRVLNFLPQSADFLDYGAHFTSQQVRDKITQVLPSLATGSHPKAIAMKSGVLLLPDKPLTNSDIMSNVAAESGTNFWNDAQAMVDFLTESDPLPTQADLIMVLGSDDLEPAREAARLYLQGKAGKILVSGGRGRLTPPEWNTEAEKMREEIMNIFISKGGMSPSAAQTAVTQNVILEDQSSNFLENIDFSLAKLEQESWWTGLSSPKVLLTSKPLGLRRAHAAFLKRFPSTVTVYRHTASTISFAAELDLDKRGELLHEALGEFRRLELYGPAGFNSIAEVVVPTDIGTFKDNLNTIIEQTLTALFFHEMVHIVVNSIYSANPANNAVLTAVNDLNTKGLNWGTLRSELGAVAQQTDETETLYRVRLLNEALARILELEYTSRRDGPVENLNSLYGIFGMFAGDTGGFWMMRQPQNLDTTETALTMLQYEIYAGFVSRDALNPSLLDAIASGATVYENFGTATGYSPPFTAISGSWGVVDDGTGNYVYEQSAVGDMSTHISVLNNVTVSDGTISTRFRMGGIDGQTMLHFRGDGYNTGYAAAVQDLGGGYAIIYLDKLVDGLFILIGGVVVSNFDISAWHTLRVKLVGSSIKVYLDDDTVNYIDAVDSTYASGSIALGTSYITAPVYFDDITYLP